MSLQIPNLQLFSNELPPDLARAISHREAALWISKGFDELPGGSATVASLVALPWQAVLLESTKGETAKEIERRSATIDKLARIRGFIHLIAEEPSNLNRTPRSLPVYMLNGRMDASDPLSSSALAPKKTLFRRLSMISEIQKLRPRVLVVLTDGEPGPLEEAFEGWGTDGFAPQLIVVDPSDKAAKFVDDWLRHAPSEATVARCVLPFDEVVRSLVGQIDDAVGDERLLVRMVRDRGTMANVDLTECEQVEFPLLNRFDLIRTRSLTPLAPADLSDKQIDRFFEGTPADGPVADGAEWAAFAAGLPWLDRSDGVQLTLQALDTCLRGGADENTIVLFPSEPGAGGTTLARAAAFAAARSGYPTLVARSEPFLPNADELAAFLTRAAQKARENESEDLGETPWLLVFDVSHWRGRERDAVAFLRELTRRGRSAVILCVIQETTSEFNGIKATVADWIRHDISQDDAIALGQHLNRFLTPRGREVPSSDWITFWEKHLPIGGSIPASFWVALSFWLRKQLDLSQTIQGWLARQFREEQVPPGGWELALEIAAMSVEREGTPEGVLAPPPNRLAAEILDEMRKKVPALALHRLGTGDRIWYVAHDLLGRLLLTIVFHDRAALTRFGLEAATDPTHLRLLLLRRVAVRGVLVRRSYQALALQFPLNIFKLEEGRLEFAPHWREVLAALDAMPPGFREQSRTYKHHAGITRRRICTITEFFDLTSIDRQNLLGQAVDLLEDALRLPPIGEDDESDLNIYNSLALAYHDLANVEKGLGADTTRLTFLWKKATDATLEAKKLDPRNSYVLETLARYLLLTAELHPNLAAEKAAEALGYVYQAMNLEKAGQRFYSLHKYAQQAIELLRTREAVAQASKLIATGNPFGHLVLAWATLAGKPGETIPATFTTFPKDRLRQALNQLKAVAEPNALILQLQYDLTVAVDEWAFADQLTILDELEVSLPRMPLPSRGAGHPVVPAEPATGGERVVRGGPPGQPQSDQPRIRPRARAARLAPSSERQVGPTATMGV